MTPTALVTEAGPAQIDPLAPAPRGMWFGHGVRVSRRRGSHRPHTDSDSVCTRRFCVGRRGDLLMVEHDLTSDELSDQLAPLLADELADRGLLRGQRVPLAEGGDRGSGAGRSAAGGTGGAVRVRGLARAR